MRFACFRCAACGHCVSAELFIGRLGILGKQYVDFLFSTKYAELPFVCSNINEIRTVEEILLKLCSKYAQIIYDGKLTLCSNFTFLALPVPESPCTKTNKTIEI